MGVYSRRRSSQFNPRFSDDRGGRAKVIDKDRRSLDEAWRAFHTARSRYNRGEATLKEVELALRGINRARHHLHLPAVGMDVGVLDGR